MARKNHRRGFQASKRDRDRKRHQSVVKPPPPPPVTDVVIPMGRCHYPHKKLRFSLEDAPKALARARADRLRRGQANPERRFYYCDPTKGGCDAYHLTSREHYTPRSHTA